MVVTSAQLVHWVAQAGLPFLRVSMVFVTAPLFAGRLVPARIRLALALVVTLVLVPVIPPPPAIDPLSPAGLLAVTHELLAGLVIGFILQLVFGAMVMGGHTIALGMGLGFASMVDPQNGVQVPVVSQYYLVLATLLFLGMDGHLYLVQLLADSFRYAPAGPATLDAESFHRLAAWGGRMFADGLLIAIPAVTALLLTNIAFGVVTRAAPQLNIFGVGFPVTLTLGFLLILFTLPVIVPRFLRLLADGFDLIPLLLRGS